MKITVFGSSQVKPNDTEYETALKLGAALAGEGWEVSSGGYKGIMEAVSKGVQSVNGKSIGITCTSFDPQAPNIYLSVNHHESDLFNRIRRLIFESDAIIVLNGGLGTLAEFSLAWILKKIGVLSKNYPIILFGDSFEKIANTASESIQVTARDLELLSLAQTIEETISLLKVFGEQSI